jgi:hypothetical protein
MHCAICNLQIAPHLINQHIDDENHKRLLLKALSGVKPDLYYKRKPNPKIEGIRLNDVDIKHSNVDNPITNDEQNSKTGDIEKTHPKIENNKRNTCKTDKIKKHIDNFDSKTVKSEVKKMDDNENLEINWESYVYVKLKDTFFKISYGSYNSIVVMGNGTVNCFVCSAIVLLADLKSHIKNTDHQKKVAQCKFLENYEGSLLRQVGN